ncbi:hypothetical protein PIB30_101580, partial [Stylosanthes scabra]|nr:hypothetical protein [Stylosanthes scabra]
MDQKASAENRVLQLNELDEFRNEAYKTPKSRKRRLRSDMTRKSSGEHLNRVKKCYFTTQ